MSSIGEGAEASTMLLLELENERSQLTSRLAGSKEELRLQKAEAAEIEHAKAEHQADVALAEEELAQLKLERLATQDRTDGVDGRLSD